MSDKPAGPPCEFRANGRDQCRVAASWAVTDPEDETYRYLCPSHVGLYSAGPNPWEAVEFECIDMMVVEVEDDGTRVVRVYIRFGDQIRSSDVRFDRVTWRSAGGE